MGIPYKILLPIITALILACLIFRKNGFELLFPHPKRLAFQTLLGCLIGLGAPILCASMSYFAGEVGFIETISDGIFFDLDTITLDGIGALILLFMRVALVEELIFRGALLIIPYLFFVWLIELIWKKTCARRTKLVNAVTDSNDISNDNQTNKQIERTTNMQSIRIVSLTVAFSLIVTQAYMFSNLHGDNPNFDSGFALVNIYLAGIMFGVICLKPGSFWLAVVVHFLWNTTSALIGSPVSGYNFYYSQSFNLFTFRELGFWSGGAFGIEGGFACTLVLSLIIARLIVSAVKAQTGILSCQQS